MATAHDVVPGYAPISEAVLLGCLDRAQQAIDRLGEQIRTAPVREAKAADKALQQARADLLEITSELASRGMDVPEVPALDDLRKQARKVG